MIIKLLNFRIQNFKGIALFASSEWNGKSINVYGDNATGKTTLDDAFQWCLFDKNSEGNSKFGIKPTDKDGNERHNLETVVEMELGLEDRTVVLKKVYKEKWTKKNGETEKEFTGHTTDYYIDGTPKQLKEFKAYVDSIVNEDTFKMLTNVHYFNSIKWEARREIIMSLCPELNSDEVLKTNPELEPLRSELARKKIEDIIKTEKATKTELNNLGKTLPARIDELYKIDYSSVKDVNEDEIKTLIKAGEDKLQEIKTKKATLGNGHEIINLEQEIRGLQMEKMQLQDFKSPKVEKLERIRQDGQNLRVQKQTEEMKIRDLESKINRLNADLKYNSDMREKLYGDYDQEQSKVFKADNCSYCGQALPTDKVKELEKHFNTLKVETLESIINKGKEVASKITNIEKELDATTQELEFAKDELKKFDEAIQAKLFEYDQVNGELDVNPNQSRIEKLVYDMGTLQGKLTNLKTGFIVNPYEEEEKSLTDEVYQLNKKLIMIEMKANNDKQIDKLTAEKTKAASDLSKCEKTLMLCDKYIVAKTNLLEHHINDNFELVKFKMFDNQVNGGISETCVATVNGTSFSDLNNAMKINAGLDIIKSLQRIYNINAPIFIDNAESVTSFIDLPETQFVKLYVDEYANTLGFVNPDVDARFAGLTVDEKTKLDVELIDKDITYYVPVKKEKKDGTTEIISVPNPIVKNMITNILNGREEN